MLVIGQYKKKLWKKKNLKQKRLNTNKKISYRRILRSTKNVRIKKLGSYLKQ